jgi:hypothetical protein
MMDKNLTAMRRIANARPEMNGVPRICRRISAWLRIGLIGMIFIVTGGSGIATAQTESVYTVGGVNVDMTADTAAAAREQAIAAGHDLAFRRLIARLVPDGGRALLPTLSPAEVTPLVLSFEIESEKRSSVRYLGTLKFRFRRSDVREFLQKSGVGFAETRSKPVLLLPVYDFAGAKLLWDDPNPWFLAWNAVPPSDGLVPVRLPSGDLADVRDISAEQAAAGNTDQLALIAERYGASAVLVAEASVTADTGSGTRGLTVATRYFGGTSDGRTAVRSFSYVEGETDDVVIGRAAMQVALQIEEDWKQENLIQFNNQSSLIAEVALADLRQWVELRRKLQGIAFLQNWQLVAMSRRSASVRLTYYGDAEQLRIALAQRDLVLEQSTVDWVLRDSRQAREVAPGPVSPDSPAIVPADGASVGPDAETSVPQPVEGRTEGVPAR